jgi:hypothetical protein
MATHAFDAPNTNPLSFDPSTFSILPAPLQNVIKQAKIVQGKPDSTYGSQANIAEVYHHSKDTITVSDPTRWGPQMLAHEATHLWQNSLPKSITSKFAPVDPKDPYFGNFNKETMLSKLKDARAQGKTLENLSDENQAVIVQAYTYYQNDKSMTKELQPWINDVTAIQNAADLDKLAKTPKHVSALYNGQKVN